MGIQDDLIELYKVTIKESLLSTCTLLRIKGCRQKAQRFNGELKNDPVLGKISDWKQGVNFTRFQLLSCVLCLSSFVFCLLSYVFFLVPFAFYLLSLLNLLLCLVNIWK